MELVSSLPVYPVSATMDTRAINVQFVRVGTTEIPPPHTHTHALFTFIHITHKFSCICHRKTIKTFLCVFFIIS